MHDLAVAARAFAGRTAAALLVGLAVFAAGSAAVAQDPEAIRRQLDESEGRLASIRGARAELRRELDAITGRLTGDSAELANVERQIEASASVRAELDVQLRLLGDRVTETTAGLLRTRDVLTVRRAVLNRRLRDIYKRGRLGSAEVLLSSTSFSDLLHRYRYLRAVALFDRMLTRQVGELADKASAQRRRLRDEGDRMALVRAENVRETEELERLERERQRRIRTSSDRRATAQTSLAQLASEEAELRATIAGLEERRRAAERAIGAASVSSITTSDLGSLAWPVEGTILWRFGPERRGRTTIPREGIAIAAVRGEPVRAVDRGTVASIVPRAAGQTVIIDHGGGFYSSYLNLEDVLVRTDEGVLAGEVVGHVGGEAENPHIEFQIYEPGALGPRAVDPVRWLTRRG